MISLVRNSETAIVVFHEIYGINENIKSKCEKLYREGYDVFCPNLLNKKLIYDYEDEEKAYKEFYKNIGIAKPVRQLKALLKELKNRYTSVFIIGYSIGATIAWLCSTFDYCDGVICFYGSKIRQFIPIRVKSSVALYFAKTEKSFDVEELAKKLRSKKNVDILKIYDCEHGFADNFSEKFNQEAHDDSYKNMIEFIEKITNKNSPANND